MDGDGNPIPDGTVIFDYADQIAANPEFAGDDKINYGDVAARAQLNYKPHRDLLFYLSYNRGIKGGNWSPAPTVFIENFRHKPEVLDAYEVGVKSTLAPNTRLNVSAFYYDYHDYQAFCSPACSRRSRTRMRPLRAVKLSSSPGRCEISTSRLAPHSSIQT